jgi:hypothetical protein
LPKGIWDSFGTAGEAVIDDYVMDGDYDPLPVVKGIKFVGIVGNQRHTLALTPLENSKLQSQVH